MFEINIANLVMFIVTMVKLTRAKPEIIKLTMVRLIMVSFDFN